MNLQDLVRKFTSRKFLAMVAAIIAAIAAYSGAEAGQAESIISLIMMGASVVAYIIGEGLVDANRVIPVEVVETTDDGTVLDEMTTVTKYRSK